MPHTENMTTPPRKTPQLRRQEGVNVITNRFLTEGWTSLKPGAHAAEIADYIRVHLTPLGRSDRWINAVERYAKMVEDYRDDLDMVRWAVIQGSIWAHMAA